MGKKIEREIQKDNHKERLCIIISKLRLSIIPLKAVNNKRNKAKDQSNLWCLEIITLLISVRKVKSNTKILQKQNKLLRLFPHLEYLKYLMYFIILYCYALHCRFLISRHSVSFVMRQGTHDLLCDAYVLFSYFLV